MTAGSPTTEHVSFDVLGTIIRVESDLVEILETLRRLWNPFVVDDGRPDPMAISILEKDGKYHLSGGGASTSRPDRDAVMVELSGRMNRSAIEQCGEFAIHAGVVMGASSTVAFPAESGQGKSTLVAACLRAGFGYLSDEALLIEATAAVRPYPKPLALDAHSMALVLPEWAASASETLLTPDDLGAVVVSESQVLGHLVVLRRRSGPPELERLTAGVTVERLLRLSFNHFRNPEKAYRLAVGAGRSSQAWGLRYDDPVEAARLLFAQFGDE